MALALEVLAFAMVALPSPVCVAGPCEAPDRLAEVPCEVILAYGGVQEQLVLSVRGYVKLIAVALGTRWWIRIMACS